MEMKSPPPCPSTATIRRNPPRKARNTPFSAIRLREPLSTVSLIPSFPLQDILTVELPENPSSNYIASKSSSPFLVENLKVFLRIRPLRIPKSTPNVKAITESKNAWPKNPKVKSNSRSNTSRNTETCVQVNDDLRSVTVFAPQSLQETKRSKSEIFEGFSRVFSPEASQSDVYEDMVKPLVDDFLKGKCGMLAALGPSGTGKTHTVFGATRDPGMVPLALRRIFSENDSNGTQMSRVFYLSMLEISSERGKGEGLIDLLHDEGDIYMHQSVVKGLQEAVVCDAQQAESLVARGMLKRATATTNSNSQSSRSQCIINIRSAPKNGDGEDDGKASPILTIVDLAGAEREKRTGNQGARLFESNFINNTSMVFSQCLRSLLEHQRNRNKPLQKYYQNSLLTKYMKEYLEGKKRMMLILTVKPGVEDYLDTSYLLRQASPFTKIKYKSLEEPPANFVCNKRPNQAFPRAEQLKKMKKCDSEASLIDERNTGRAIQLAKQEIAKKLVKGGRDEIIEEIAAENLTEIPVLSDESVVLESNNKLPLSGDHTRNEADNDRQHKILQGLSKAFWTLLKQYKKEVEELKTENGHLRGSLINEKSRSLDLENELSEKMKLFDLDSELKEFKIRCTCRKASIDMFPVSSHAVSSNTEYLWDESQEEVEGLLESNNDARDVKGSIDTCTGAVYSISKDVSVITIDDLELNYIEITGTVDCEITHQSMKTCFVEQDAVKNVEDEKNMKRETGDAQDVMNINDNEEVNVFSVIQNLSISNDDAQDIKGSIDTCFEAVHSTSKDLSVIANDNKDFNFFEIMGTGDCEVSSQSTRTCSVEEDSIKIVMEDEKNMEIGTGDAQDVMYINDIGKVNVLSLMQELSVRTNDDQDFNFIEIMGTADCKITNQSMISCSVEKDAARFMENEKNMEPETGFSQDVMDLKDKGTVNVFSSTEDLSVSTNNDQDLTCFKDIGSVNCDVTSQLTSVCTSCNCEQDIIKNTGDENNLESKSESASNGSSQLTSLECHQEEISSATVHSENLLNSSISSEKDHTCFSVEEELPNKEEDKEVECLSDSNDDARDVKGSINTCTGALFYTSKDLSVMLDNDEDLNFVEVRSTADCEVTSLSMKTCSVEEDALKIVEDEKKMEIEMGAAQDVMDINDNRKVNMFSIIQNFSVSANDNQDLNCFKDTGAVDCELSSQSTSARLYTSCNGEQDAGDEFFLESRSESLSYESSRPTSAVCKSVETSSDNEDLKDGNGMLAQLEDHVDQTSATGTTHLDNLLNSSLSSQKDHTCLNVEKEKPDKEENKEQVDPQVINLTKEDSDIRKMSKSTRKLSRGNVPHKEKPKRFFSGLAPDSDNWRLQPASSVLLKDISIVNVMDEDDQPKGGRGRRKVPMDDKNRTKGSSTLLHLLKTKLGQ